MKISLQNAGKRYNKEWIFRHFSYEFFANKSYAITGANGSGKSTLLQVIAGSTLHSQGTIIYTDASEKPIESSYQTIAIAAPYLELIEELTATELLQFHAGFKKLTAPAAEILAAVNLGKAANKQIRYFSSGMKQRLKLAQAFFSETYALFLDEPTTNLDAEGTALYHNLVANYANDRLIIVSSNVPDEYAFCTDIINIENYK